MNELRGMSDEQLALALKDTEKHLFQLRFQSATDRLETPSEIRKAKRDIARIRTLQRAKELAKLEGLPVEQVGTRIASLSAKEAANLPGKRTAHRQVARLKRFYAAKGGKFPLPAASAPVNETKAPAPAPKAAAPAKTEAKKGSGK